MKQKILLMMLALFAVAMLAACSKQSAEKQETGGQNVENTDQSATDQTATTDQSQSEDAKTDNATADQDQKVAEKPKSDQPTEKKPEKKDPPTKKEEPPQPKVVTLPESSLVRITLVDSIDTDIHVTGTEFRASISEPVVYNGEVLFEKGAVAVGVLNKVVESGRLKTPAELSFSLVSIADRSGQQVLIDTYPIDEKKGSHTKEQVGLIGGGALVGGIIGKVTGKKGGTEIGAVAGAAAGAAAAAAAGKNDITLHAGTEVQFLLRAPVKVTVPQSGQMAND
jgi:DNA mismatch repair ATPase MutL